MECKSYCSGAKDYRCCRDCGKQFEDCACNKCPKECGNAKEIPQAKEYGFLITGSGIYVTQGGITINPVRKN